MQNDLVKAIVLGGGGHSRVLIDAALRSNTCELVGVLDNCEDLWGQDILGISLLGGDQKLPDLKKQGVSHYLIGVGSVAKPDGRQRVHAVASEAGFESLNIIHPTAIYAEEVFKGSGIQCFAGAIINVGSVIKNHVIINTGAIVEHDCIIEDFAHISPGAVMCGQVTVGKAAHIGAGAVIKQGLSIGDGAIVGAGAVVTHSVEAGVTVVGNPARPL